MWQKRRRILAVLSFAVFGAAAISTLRTDSDVTSRALAQTTVTPTPAPQAFDQASAVAKLREQIKDKENEPAEKVFKITRRFGNIAHVFSTYKWETADKKESGGGVNSIELHNDGKRWWISAVSWDEERPDNPIPKEFLGKDKK